MMASAPAEQARLIPGKIITVDFDGQKPAPAYDIVIGENIINEAATLIRLRLGYRHCVIVTDANVAPLYLARFSAMLAAGGHDVVAAFALPAGEANKNVTQLQSMLEKMLTVGLDRQTLIIALGGGVVGDMAGLAASLVMRGLDYVQVPTTLLAQVDSSVGGKTGVDTAHGKNMIGTFHQPRLVLADVAMLDSLPPRDLRAGYAEIVKYGLINDAAFFGWCQTHGQKLLAGEHDAQISAVGYSCAAKAKIVAADEREAGQRALLNLGHTFGHALEALGDYGPQLTHGEAVALGILLAFRLSAKMGLCPSSDYDAIRAHFVVVGLPTTLPAFAKDIDRLVDLMAHDKKAQGGKITLILARGIGQCFIQPDVDRAAIRDVWQEFLSV